MRPAAVLTLDKMEDDVTLEGNDDVDVRKRGGNDTAEHC
jgi:hypothetical protein